MRKESRLTARGRLTMPAEIRNQAHVQAGTRFNWEVDGDGNILLKPLRLGLSEVSGMFRLDHHLSDAAIQKAIGEGGSESRG